jgi:cellulose synthase/poly-beta-1,6-N-acetylglucosamine synthase-like glycosyltransferase
MLLGSILFLHLIYVIFIAVNYYYLRKVNFYQLKNRAELYVSVVIPARNEADRLPDLLHSLWLQTYPKKNFEVIIIDDDSSDNSLSILKKYQDDHQELNIQILTGHPQYEGAYKKQALTQGIHQAKGEIILQTDADVILPPQWIERMVNAFDEKTVLVAGPVRYITNNVFTNMQALELAGLVGLSASGFAMNRPFLCNGANMAFRKSVFEEVGGYEGINHIASGDDMLLLQKIQLLYPYCMSFVWSADVIVDTYPCDTISEWWMQRRRWVSKSLAYLNFSTILTHFIAYLYHIGLIAVFFMSDDWSVLLTIWLTKIGADAIFLNFVCQFLGRSKWLRWLLVAECLYPFYVMLVGLSAILLKKYEWKGRIQQ